MARWDTFLLRFSGLLTSLLWKKGNEVIVITSFVAASAAFHPVLFLSHTDEEHVQRLIFVGKIYNTLYDHRKDQHFVQQAWSDVEFVLLHTGESGSGLRASCIQTPWPAALRRYRRRRTAQCAGVGAPSAAPPPAGSPAGWTHLRPSESVNTCRLYFSINTRSYIVALSCSSGPYLLLFWGVKNEQHCIQIQSLLYCDVTAASLSHS